MRSVRCGITVEMYGGRSGAGDDGGHRLARSIAKENLNGLASDDGDEDDEGEDKKNNSIEKPNRWAQLLWKVYRKTTE